MNKREQRKFEKALAEYAALTGVDTDKLKEEIDIDSLYTEEDSMYEGQAVINFFTYRIKPILDGKKPGEKETRFNQRKEEWEQAYHEWRIRTCATCNLEFAYALSYEGVKYCSIFCLDKALEEMGLHVTRGRDLRQRWGYQQHPAIVPSSAFQALKEIYPHAESSFAPSQ